jgi:hypothetical protein
VGRRKRRGVGEAKEEEEAGAKEVEEEEEEEEGAQRHVWQEDVRLLRERERFEGRPRERERSV